MSYCTGKNIENARGKAMKMLVIEKKPVGVVADRFGVNRSTIWRWHQKWLTQNNHIALLNPSRRRYLGVSPYKYELCKWGIPSFSTAPKISISSVRRILKRNNRMKKPKTIRTGAIRVFRGHKC